MGINQELQTDPQPHSKIVLRHKSGIPTEFTSPINFYDLVDYEPIGVQTVGGIPSYNEYGPGTAQHFDNKWVFYPKGIGPELTVHKGEWYEPVGKITFREIPLKARVAAPDYGKLGPIEHDLKRFVDAMRFKLLKNAHKGKWEGLDLRSVLDKLEDEVKELRLAIEQGNTVEILLEAADVANFAMMAASIAVERGR